jgi:hypothetical protein
MQGCGHIQGKEHITGLAVGCVIYALSFYSEFFETNLVQSLGCLNLFHRYAFEFGLEGDQPDSSKGCIPGEWICDGAYRKSGADDSHRP